MFRLGKGGCQTHHPGLSDVRQVMAQSSIEISILLLTYSRIVHDRYLPLDTLSGLCLLQAPSDSCCEPSVFAEEALFHCRHVTVDSHQKMLIRMKARRDSSSDRLDNLHNYKGRLVCKAVQIIFPTRSGVTAHYTHICSDYNY